jgi:twitching motility protein PilT|nr:twitching motility protein PilT [Patescibacteria group bacterium]
MSIQDYKVELEELLGTVVKEGASDLHLSDGRQPMLRINGSLIPLIKKSVLKKEDTDAFLSVLVPSEKKKRFLETKELDFSYSFEDSARFRGNAFFQQGKVSIALRLITKKIPTLAELHLPEILSDFTRKKQGFFLLVGPVGQGKSTTLASMLNLINEERAEHIITIEDPIEYQYEPKKSIIDQREVGLDTNDFYSALISVLREDVNVLLVGEMRNPETMAAAVTAAETGHLVFSTLHTNNAAQTIDRIIDSFPSTQQDQIRIQLAASLIGVFSQRLIPRISGGRVPAFELLISNSAVANLIREKRVHEINTVIETSSEQGMIDMNRCLADLVRSGEISIENAYRYAFNPKMLERLI